MNAHKQPWGALALEKGSLEVRSLTLAGELVWQVGVVETWGNRNSDTLSAGMKKWYKHFEILVISYKVRFTLTYDPLIKLQLYFKVKP